MAQDIKVRCYDIRHIDTQLTNPTKYIFQITTPNPKLDVATLEVASVGLYVTPTGAAPTGAAPSGAGGNALPSSDYVWGDDISIELQIGDDAIPKVFVTSTIQNITTATKICIVEYDKSIYKAHTLESSSSNATDRISVSKETAGRLDSFVTTIPSYLKYVVSPFAADANGVTQIVRPLIMSKSTSDLSFDLITSDIIFKSNIVQDQKAFLAIVDKNLPNQSIEIRNKTPAQTFATYDTDALVENIMTQYYSNGNPEIRGLVFDWTVVTKASGDTVSKNVKTKYTDLASTLARKHDQAIQSSSYNEQLMNGYTHVYNTLSTLKSNNKHMDNTISFLRTGIDKSEKTTIITGVFLVCGIVLAVVATTFLSAMPLASLLTCGTLIVVGVVIMILALLNRM